MNLSGKTVFVAGGSGMLGRAIVQHLIEKYPETKIQATCFGQTPDWPKDQVKAVKGDLRNLEDCRQLCRGCDMAIMAAASTGGAAQLVNQPWKQVNDNLFMNAQMFDAFQQEGIRRVVFVGSATAYQNIEGCLKEEDLNLQMDPHPAHFGIGWTMRYLEKLCTFWHQTAGLEVMIVRASNIFGPYAKFDPQVSNFIPALIRKAVDKMDPFEIWGSPDVVRDVIYVEDMARAIAQLLCQEKIHFDVFNVGSSAATRIGDVVTWANQFAQHQPSQILYKSDKPSTIKNRILDCAKMNRMTGWQPIYSIQEGIQKTVEWWIKNRYSWSR